MANFIYNEAKRLLAAGGLNWAADDIRVLLVMSSTTADTEDDVNFISEITTLDEYDGAGYPSTFATRKAIANEAIIEDAANNRAELDGDDVTYTGLGVGTRQAQGMIVYRHGASDAASVPLAFIDTGGFPFDGNGGDVTIQWNAEGILQVT